MSPIVRMSCMYLMAGLIGFTYNKDNPPHWTLKILIITHASFLLLEKGAYEMIKKPFNIKRNCHEKRNFEWNSIFRVTHYLDYYVITYGRVNERKKKRCNGRGCQGVSQRQKDTS